MYTLFLKIPYSVVLPHFLLLLMLQTLFTLTADSGLGRCDAESLSDQIRMELFVADLSDEFKDFFQDGAGKFLDVCEWDGVECNAYDEVVDIQWYDTGSTGTVHLHFLPKRVQLFEMCSNGHSKAMTGTLETSTLPDKIRAMKLTHHSLHGTVDLTNLPASLIDFSIMVNKFSGTVNLMSLPAEMRSLVLDCNCFAGSLCIGNIGKLEVLSISNNLLSGSLHIAEMRSLSFLGISNNNLSGEFCITHSSGYADIDATENAFEGVAVVPGQYVGLVLLRGNGIAQVVDERGNEHPDMERILHAPSL